MNKRLEIQIGNKKLIAELNDWSDECPKELCVYLEDENGCVAQDIGCVREHFAYNEDTYKWIIDTAIDCLVWGSSDSKDDSTQFSIGVYAYEDD